MITEVKAEAICQCIVLELVSAFRLKKKKLQQLWMSKSPLRYEWVYVPEVPDDASDTEP